VPAGQEKANELLEGMLLLLNGTFELLELLDELDSWQTATT
jgi:hypothetical protein